eukprot:TRINITY_DN2952_c0_g2_i11.p1 TRINITY_DN2952_c0_g2~~TRINITY_DN2952_c0_g2_i11.p1  ORF type:complete len:202 (+),score=13.69 TRINITY_DN2952_c0_g2_i11:48-608(+)
MCIRDRNEIESADLKPDEDKDLEERFKIISNSEKIKIAINEAIFNLNGDTDCMGAIQKIEQAYRYLNKEDVMPELKEVATKLESAFYDIEDYFREISDLGEGIEYSNEELDEIQLRIDLIQKLKLKYGKSIYDILEYLENLKRELNEIKLADETKEKLTEEYDKTYKKCKGPVSYTHLTLPTKRIV